MGGKSPHEGRGIVLLDSFTYPKILPNEQVNVLVLFTNKLEIGQDAKTDLAREAFFQMGSEGGLSEDLLLAQVVINGAQNSILAQRAGVEHGAKRPHLMLYKKGSSAPIHFTGPHLNIATLKRFASKFTDFEYHSPGNLKEYDAFVLEFIAAEDEEGRQSVVAAAEAFLQEHVKDEKKMELCEYYIKCFKKILEEGWGWTSRETQRLMTIQNQGTVTIEAKMALIGFKINIVAMFDRDFLVGAAAASDDAAAAASTEL